MNLIIDIGNTFIKWAVFEGNTAIETNRFLPGEHLNLTGLDKYLAQINRCIISSVNALPEALQNYLSGHRIDPLFFSSETPIPVQSDYESMHTLGLDRLAGVVGAYYLYPSSPCLVIDMGSAITYDLLTDNGLYLGGSIAPGMQMRFRALHQMTARLPLISPSFDYRLPSKNTTEAIQSGVIQGIVHELNGTIGHFKNNYDLLNIILTGGDAQFFEKSIKKPIFVVSELILRGLNYILQYNAKNN